MWMFGPATLLYLPGNGWRTESSQSWARWLGGHLPTAPLREQAKVPSPGEDPSHRHPCRAQVSLEALCGPLSWLLSCRPQCLA